MRAKDFLHERDYFFISSIRVFWILFDLSFPYAIPLFSGNTFVIVRAQYVVLVLDFWVLVLLLLMGVS